MFRFLSRLVGTGKGSAGRRPASAPRPVKLGFEVLEGRALPSVSPIHGAVGPALIGQVAQVAYVAPVVDVAYLAGVSFHLTSSTGKPPHDLTIQTETYLPDGSATFTGTWAGGGANGKSHAISGTLQLDANGNITIAFSWTNGAGTQNSFLGTITRINNQGPAAAAYAYGNHYHLEGDVTTPVQGGGPGHVSGDGGIPYPVLKAAF
jgi:hypothetical protein